MEQAIVIGIVLVGSIAVAIVGAYLLGRDDQIKYWTLRK